MCSPVSRSPTSAGPGAPAIRAERTNDGGWQLDGHAPWATSWGVADWFAIAAASDDGDVVWVKVPGHEVPGLVATPLALSVFATTGTVALTFERYEVAAADVISVGDLDTWRRTDRRHAALGQPAVLGVAERAARLLAERRRRRRRRCSQAARRRTGRALEPRW